MNRGAKGLLLKVIDCVKRYSILVRLGIVIVLFGVVIAKFHLYLYEKSNLVTIEPEKDDRPIRTLAEDRIPGFKNIAEKILSHLQLCTETDNHGPNVAMIGSYGSGKTSLCNLIEDTYNKLPGDQKKIKIKTKPLTCESHKVKFSKCD